MIATRILVDHSQACTAQEGCLPVGGVSPGRGCLPREGFLPRGSVCPGGVCPRGSLPHMPLGNGVDTPLWTDTHLGKQPSQTSFAGRKNKVNYRFIALFSFSKVCMYARVTATFDFVRVRFSVTLT